MTETTIQLDPAKILPERPFTHPAHTAPDLATLRHMLDQVCLFMETRLTTSTLFDPVMLPEPDGRFHRYLVPRPVELARANRMAVVGFFGQKRASADPDHFGNLGQRLIEEIPTYPGILSYSTLQLPSGNFSNLVILRDESIKEPWRTSQTHTQALDRSPSYYASVRIYNGILHGLASPESLRLLKVKYWDYRTEPVWRGVRNLKVERNA